MNYLILLSVLFLTLGCKQKQQEVSQRKSDKVENNEGSCLCVYNMGGVPQKDVDKLVRRLKSVYPNTVYAGELALVENAYIANDNKGKNRYCFSKLLPYMKDRVDVKKNIALVLVNAEVCNWTRNGSHANLGISVLGGHISFVSYQRLKVNGLNTDDDIFKVAIHELGHSVARLAANRKDLRGHCPDNACLMRDACNGYPYRDVNSFCENCSREMQAKGFNLSSIGL